MKYAVLFLAGSVGLAIVAFPLTASSAIILWGSLALGLVGLAYAGVGPRIFGKRSDGGKAEQVYDSDVISDELAKFAVEPDQEE